MAARRTWRKLHLAVDENHQIIACLLTTPETGDTTAEPDSQVILGHQPAAQVIVLPHKIAVCTPAGDTQWDNPIRDFGQQWRIAWQKKTGYGLRNYVELNM